MNTLINLIRTSIKFRFITYIVLLILVVAVTVGSALIWYETKTYEKFVEDRAVTIVKNIASSTIPFFYSYNLGSLQQLSDEVTKEQDVLYAIFYTKENIIAGATGMPSLQKTTPSDSVINKIMSSDKIQISRLEIVNFPSRYTNVLVITYPVIPKGENRRWGTVTLGISLSELNDQINRVRQFSILITALLLVFGASFAALIGNKITKPILDLVKATRLVGEGSLDLHVEVNYDDEIGELGNSFNKMIGELKSYRSKLEGMTNELEKRVEERTSKLKESEKNLLVQKTYFEELFNFSPYAIVILNNEDKIMQLNKVFIDFFGYSEKEAMGKQINDLIVPEEMKEEGLELTNKVANGESISKESERRKKNGELVTVAITGTPIKFSDDQIGVYGIYRDISDRKKAEAERQELEKKLKQAEKMESLGILAGGVAHDLNNTLVPILALPDLIIKKRPDDKELIKMVKLIRDASKRAADTVNDMLTLARRGKYDMKPYNLNNLLKSYFISSTFDAIEERFPKVKMKLNLSENIPTIKASESHISQVLMNLVNNAYEAMPEGGVLIVRTSEVHLSESISGYEEIQKGDYVLLEFEDNGTGIDKEDFYKIFEPFYTDKKMGESGSGLGLAVVWGVLKDHEAYVDVKTKVDVGTTFSVYFPATTEVIEESVQGETSIEGTEQMLVVDDRHEQREIADEILSSLGYKVDTVEGGRQAVEFIKKNKVDLVILDMVMEEGFDGLDTFRTIREINPTQKAIIVSGYAETDRVKEALKLGVGKYIKKPYTIEDIGKAVREELDRK